MVRAVYGRSMVLSVLILGLTLMTCSTRGNAAPQQQRRMQYRCHTCANSSAQQPSGKALQQDPMTDFT